jgi:hypothetical protein
MVSVTCPLWEPDMVMVCPLVDTLGAPDGSPPPCAAVPAGTLAAGDAAGLVVVEHPLITTAASNIVKINNINKFFLVFIIPPP